ncbi:UDP-4-amino-4,6-dideoxy-N-acetyl-beta-L-altrosamine N-acetyltransferase [Clostridium sp. ZS1]|uniref:UDP-4-amino-4, 6-dideoxy-N-acetyl-beta-L-altrosamine N-acetyltransferase n=1 Tax=Clostridium sp. ZS1 TaxID=2949989 RepID=UPI00207AE85B|nr:UDP-4-amino-4,6-dideoxy-N-acetyl-beta-L-altrosamine N-acetyltransferase [Clostridium sp. ZS1]
MLIKLSKIKKEHLGIIAKWRMMPEVTQYMYTDPVLTLSTQLKWFERINKDETVKYWIIKADNIKIGVINLCDIDYKNKKCTWGYYISEASFRGRGIARTLECNIYDYVFENLNLNKLYSEVFASNEKVIEIHKKFGSEIEGVLKEHIFKNDKMYDVVTMGITKRKWKSIKSNYDYEKVIIE